MKSGICTLDLSWTKLDHDSFLELYQVASVERNGGYVVICKLFHDEKGGTILYQKTNFMM